LGSRWEDRTAELAMASKHEVDDLGGDSIRSTNKVPLVLAVLVIEHDHDLASRNRFDCRLDSAKSIRHT
jgi:hypothetical protein